VHQIATICYAHTGRRPDQKTIKRVLADNPLPERTARRFPLYDQIANPIEGLYNKSRATSARAQGHLEDYGHDAPAATQPAPG
jgi:hypothetical protein